MKLFDNIKKSNVVSIDLWVAFVIEYFMIDSIYKSSAAASGVLVDSAPAWITILSFVSFIALLYIVVWLVHKCGMLKDCRYLMIRDACTIKHKKMFTAYFAFGFILFVWALYAFNLVSLGLTMLLAFVLSVKFEYEELT